MKATTTLSVCRSLSDKFDATCEMKGSSAYTNGNHYVVPDLGQDLTNEQHTILRGYLDHEAGGHGAYTNFDVKKPAGALGNMFNLFEDFRVENLLGKKYPGCKNNLTALNNHLINDKIKKEDAFKALFVEGYRKVADQKIEYKDMTELATSYYGNDIFDRLAAMTSSQDALDLAAAILDELKEKAEDTPPPPAPPSSDSDEKDEGDDTNDTDDDEGNGTGDDSDNENDEGEGDDETDTDDDTDEYTDDEGDDSGDDENATENDDTAGDSKGKPADDDESTVDPDDIKNLLDDLNNIDDKGDMIREELEEMHEDGKADRKYMIFETSRDEFVKVEPAGTMETFDSMKKSLGNLNIQKTKIANMFRAKTASRFIGDQERGKINNRSLAKIATGNRRVFKSKYQSQAMDTAISFLVDFSGSMGFLKTQAAMNSVILFLESLNHIGIKTEVLGYTTDNEYPSTDEFPSGYGRVEGLVTYEFKTFADQYNKKTKLKIANFDSLGRKQNCDPCSVRLAHDRLAVRPEKRKVLFVLTDGAVDNLGSTRSGKRELKRLVKEIESSNKVEIVAVDLMSGSAQLYYSNVIEVERAGDLPNQLFAGLRNVLKV